MRWEKLELKAIPREDEGKKKRGRKGGREGPGKKWGHTLNVIRGGKHVYVFGGYGRNERQTNDVYMYNTGMERWSKPYVRGSLPPPRDSHTCTLVSSRLYVFGGTDGTYGLNDLHYLDTNSNTWVNQQVKSNVVPKPREGHAAASLGNKLYVFGGCGKAGEGGEDAYFNDVFVFDPEVDEWNLLPTLGTPPAARDSHSCSSWGHNLVVFGGEDSTSSYLNDVHLLDTTTLEWTLLKTTGDKPQARAGHAAVAVGRFLVVFGGFADNRHLFNDLHILDLSTGRWDRQMTAGIAPTPRFSLAADLLDPASGQILFFGGCNDGLEALDDMYILHTNLALDHGSILPSGERLSLKKELKRRSQLGLDASPPGKRHLLGDLEVSDFGKAQQYFGYEYRSVAERLFEAKITDVFHFGYFLEAKIDGLPLEGMLFTFKNGFEQSAHMRLHQRRVQEENERLLAKEVRRKERKEKRIAAIAAEAQAGLEQKPNIPQESELVLERKMDQLHQPDTVIPSQTLVQPDLASLHAVDLMEQGQQNASLGAPSNQTMFFHSQ